MPEGIWHVVLEEQHVSRDGTPGGGEDRPSGPAPVEVLGDVIRPTEGPP